MTDGTRLARLADEAGVLRVWRDVHGRGHCVAEPTLRALLDAQGLACASPAQAADSLRRLREESLCVEGGMVVARAGEPVELRHRGPLQYRVALEGGDGLGAHRKAHPPAVSHTADPAAGASLAGEAERTGPDTVRLPSVSTPGYHRLEIGGTKLVLAVAPMRCPAVPRRAGAGGAWGVAAQLYSLRRAVTPASHQRDLHGAGDYGALAELAAMAGEQGACALGISPVHAMFSADPSRYSPYAPSSRMFLNTAYIDAQQVLGAEMVEAALARPGGERALGPEHGRGGADERGREAHGGDGALIDWPRVARARLDLACRLFDMFERHGPPALRQSWNDFRRAGGADLEGHCRYEALHAHHASSLGPGHGWQAWPAPLRDHAGAAVASFARAHAREVAFHAFLQWLASEGMRHAQQAARAAGMAVGLIADLAIGTDVRGSHAWSRPQDILARVSVGAAPDLHQPAGQDWRLAVFSPRALRETAFRPYLQTLRAALAHAGGVRVDHILGLSRMWLVPQGADAAQGAYLRYPLRDMLRLLALEAWRHDAIVIGENLGTVPEGFDETLEEHGVLGTSVLWFARKAEQRARHDGEGAAEDGQAPDAGAEAFLPPAQWPAHSAATTTTHDLPTVAGWWEGRELQWLARLGRLSEQALRGQALAREQDRRALWRALREAGLASAQDEQAAFGGQGGRRGKDGPAGAAGGTGKAGKAAGAAGCPAESAGAARNGGSMDASTAVGPLLPGRAPRLAILSFVAATPAPLCLVPLEDLLGLAEQPNLPGPEAQAGPAHPNWLRRLPVGVEDLFGHEEAASGVQALRRAGRGT